MKIFSIKLPMIHKEDRLQKIRFLWKKPNQIEQEKLINSKTINQVSSNKVHKIREQAH